MSAALSSAPLRIVVADPVDGVVRVTVTGEVDTVSAGQLRAALTGVAADPAVRGLVVDLTGVPFVAVAGLHPLLEASAAAEAGRRTMRVLAGPAGGVQGLLERAGVLV
ncbi:STAS domain-containing protein [Klenkia taihuensis]|uniref:Anti-anti-sigma factor n=1 Tax=Klenkia taihuensis TaxID=1225127 RepID=A0A1I1V1Z3_9ACTN|nr:STAS domain-containing protein [Klenkia taihuensis]GHE14581.1 hypothetical protein GCM10011381_41750 [Klenkia taihuensis]SFD77057.1 anti-anti-sigma factor [Klenkia taihuensis]